MILLIPLLIIAIPLLALIDYFAFRKKLEHELGHSVEWYYFIVPTTIEVFCFVSGYFVGSYGCTMVI